MFLAFIWYAYCACKSKIWIFQKIVLLKTKKFLCKTNKLQGSLTKKLRKKGSFSMILKVNKDASFHIRPFLFDLYEIWQWIRMIKRNVPLWPPPPYRLTKKPTLIRVKSMLSSNCKLEFWNFNIPFESHTWKRANSIRYMVCMK